jgi:hypothetical protein
MESNKIIIDDPNVLKFFEDNNSLDKNEFIANLIANYKDTKSDKIVQNSELNNEKGSIDSDNNIDCKTVSGIDRDDDIIANEISNDGNDNHIKNNTATDSDINIHGDKDDTVNTNITNAEPSIIEAETKELFLTTESDGYESIEISKHEIKDVKIVNTDFEEEKEVERMILQEGETDGKIEEEEAEREGDMEKKEIKKEDTEVEREGDIEVEGRENEESEVEQKIVVDEVRDNFDMNVSKDNKGYSVTAHDSADNLADNLAQNLADTFADLAHDSGQILADVAHDSALICPEIFNSIPIALTISMNRYQHFIYNNSITHLPYNYVSTEEVSTPGFGGEVLPITISTNDGSNYDDNNVVSTDEEYNTISPLLSAFSTGFTSPNLGSRPDSPLLLPSSLPSALSPSPFFPFLRQEVEIEGNELDIEVEMEGKEVEEEKKGVKKEVEKEGEMEEIEVKEEVEREEEGDMDGREGEQEGEIMLQEVEREGEMKGNEVEKEGEKGGEMGSDLFEESKPLRSHFDPLIAELDPLEGSENLNPISNPLGGCTSLNPGLDSLENTESLTSNSDPLEESKALNHDSDPLEGFDPLNPGSNPNPLEGSKVFKANSDPLEDFTPIAPITTNINKFQNFINHKDTEKNSENVDEDSSQNIILTPYDNNNDHNDDDDNQNMINDDDNDNQGSNGNNSGDDVNNNEDSPQNITLISYDNNNDHNDDNNQNVINDDDNQNMINDDDNDNHQSIDEHRSGNDVYTDQDKDGNDENSAPFTSTPLDPTPSDPYIRTPTPIENTSIPINTNMSKFQSFGSTLKFRHIQVYFMYIYVYVWIYIRGTISAFVSMIFILLYI